MAMCSLAGVLVLFPIRREVSRAERAVSSETDALAGKDEWMCGLRQEQKSSCRVIIHGRKEDIRTLGRRCWNRFTVGG